MPEGIGYPVMNVTKAGVTDWFNDAKGRVKEFFGIMPPQGGEGLSKQTQSQLEMLERGEEADRKRKAKAKQEQSRTSGTHQGGVVVPHIPVRGFPGRPDVPLN